MLVCCGLQTQGNIRLAALDQSRGFGVSPGSALIAVDLIGRNSEPLQFPVQPEARARACVAVHEPDVRAGEISYLPDGFRIPRPEHQPLRAVCKSDHIHVAVGEETPDVGRVVFAALVQEMRTRYLA